MGMVAATTNKHWTAAELRAIPDDRNRYEIIDGELLVSPSPTYAHQRLVTRLLIRINAYLEEHRIGEVIVSPADVELADDTVVQPDVFVAPLVDGKPPRTWKELGRLLLVIEVLSPSTARADRTVKRQRFQREGIPEYWIVDGDARIVERWRPEDGRPEVISETLEWRPNPEFASLTLDLPDLFTETLGN